MHAICSKSLILGLRKTKQSQRIDALALVRRQKLAAIIPCCVANVRPQQLQRQNKLQGTTLQHTMNIIVPGLQHNTTACHSHLLGSVHQCNRCSFCGFARRQLRKGDHRSFVGAAA